MSINFGSITYRNDKESPRFLRNTLDSIKYTRELLSYEVAVLFVNDKLKTTTNFKK